MSTALTILAFVAAGIGFMIATFFVAFLAGYVSRMYAEPFQMGRDAYDKKHKKASSRLP